MYRKLALLPLLSFVVSPSLTLLENDGAAFGSLTEPDAEAPLAPLTPEGQPHAPALLEDTTK